MKGMCCANDVMVVQMSQLGQIKHLEDEVCILEEKLVAQDVRATLPSSTLFADCSVWLAIS